MCSWTERHLEDAGGAFPSASGTGGKHDPSLKLLAA